MDCPQCAEKVTRKKLADGSSVFYCDKCGWGKEKALQSMVNENQQEVMSAPVSISSSTYLKLSLFWLVTLLIIIGPYFGLVYGIPFIAEMRGWDVNINPPNVANTLNPQYWIVMGIYLIVALTFTPTYDPSNLGLFGTSWINNPFSFEDDYNRNMRALAFLLIPGKFVWITLKATYRVAKVLICGKA